PGAYARGDGPLRRVSHGGPRLRSRLTGTRRPGSDPLVDQHGHAVGTSHHPVVMTRRLADHITNRPPVLIRYEQSADARFDEEPHAPSFQPVIRRDVPGDPSAALPAAFAD